MAMTPMNPQLNGGPPLAPPTPGTDMTGICFRDQLWLNTYPLDRNLVFDYFALSPFYDFTCTNQKLRDRAIHPLDIPELSKLTGIEYALCEVSEPHLFVFRKQKRDNPEKVTPLLTYYILDGSIYQAPQLCNVFASRVGRALHHISKAFSTAQSKLEKIGYDAESDSAPIEPKAAKEPINFKELKRVDHILASLQRKLPPAPPPPPFLEGYNPPTTEVGEKGSDAQKTDPLPSVDPILDEGPAKRMRI